MAQDQEGPGNGTLFEIYATVMELCAWNTPFGAGVSGAPYLVRRRYDFQKKRKATTEATTPREQSSRIGMRLSV
jgi:hypothetical protein